MIPGGRINEHNIKMMMKKMGISTSNMEDVVEVVIYTRDKEYHIKEPRVTVAEAQGVKTYQVVGEVTEKKKEAYTYPKEDIDLVTGQTGVTEEAAVKALKEANGMPAEAIQKILSGKSN